MHKYLHRKTNRDDVFRYEFIKICDLCILHTKTFPTAIHIDLGDTVHIENSLHFCCCCFASLKYLAFVKWTKAKSSDRSTHRPTDRSFWSTTNRFRFYSSGLCIADSTMIQPFLGVNWPKLLGSFSIHINVMIFILCAYSLVGTLWCCRIQLNWSLFPFIVDLFEKKEKN